MAAMQVDMRDTMFRVEAALARVVAASRGLRVEARPAVQGPFTLSYPVHLGAYDRDGYPTPASAEHIRKFLCLGPAFAESVRHAGVPVRGTVRVADVDGYGLVIEVPSPSPWLPAGRDLAAHTSGLRVAVGIDQWRRPAHVDLRVHHGLMLIGATGSGKTLSALSSLYGLARANKPCDMVYLILAAKRDTWLPLARADHCLGLASTPAEMRAAGRWVVAELDRRNREGYSTPTLVVVVDDAHRVFEADPTLGRMLAALWTTGRERRVIPWYTTQAGGSNRATGDSIAEDNARARLLFKTTSGGAAARASGQSGTGLHLLSGKTGDAALSIDNAITRIATAWLTDTSDLESGDDEPLPVWRSASPSPSLSPVTGGFKTPGAPRDAGVGDSDSDSDTLPRRAGRGPLTAEDRAAIRARFQMLGSATAVAESYFGARNGRNVRLVADVLDEGGDA